MSLRKDIQNAFRSGFESKCQVLILSAFSSCLKDNLIQRDWDENDITSELHSKIVDDNDRLKWLISCNVEHHISTNPVVKKKGFSSKFPRIDLRMSTFGASIEYEYFFEAKNLKEKDSHLKRRYIDTGIDSFVSGKYFNGSLLGYLLEGNSAATVSGINKLLVKDNRSSEILYSSSLKVFKNLFKSKHKGINELKHFILDFQLN